MGLFSSKKKYTVNVTVQGIFEESQIPQSPTTGLIKGIMDNGDVVEYMLEEVAGSIGIKTQAGFSFMKKQVNDPIGLPTSHTTSFISARTSVFTTIEANQGQDITPVYYYMGPLNSMHYGWQYCYSALGYDPNTNELHGVSASTGFPCYLSDMKATYLREDYDFMVQTADMGMLAQMGPSPQSGYTPSKPINVLSSMGQFAEQPAFEVSDVSTEDYITISYEFVDATGAIITRGVTVSMAAFDNTADFHMCRYKMANGQTGFFTYQHGTGTYPGIDVAYALEYNPLGSFLPWTYFRSGGRNSKDVESAATIKRMTKWCKYIGVDYDSMNDAVHGDSDVSDVEQTILLFAVKPGAQHPAELEYLYKHFTGLYENSLSQRELAGTLYESMDNYTTSPSQMNRVLDNRFVMDFQYSGIKRKRVGGKIGKKGDYTGHFEMIPQQQYRSITQGKNGTGTQLVTVDHPSWVYRYQVLDSMYEEITVFNYRVNYEVHRKKGFAAGGQDAELLIPLDYAIVATISVGTQEQLLCRAMQMMVNTVIVTKTKWYQSTWFKIVILIVIVVITVLTWGGGSALMAAYAAGGYTALAIAVTIIIIKMVVIHYATKLFIKAVGPEIGLVIAIVAMLYGSYEGITALEGAETWSETLLAVGNNLVAEAQSAYGDMLDDIQDDILAFNEYAQGKFDSLEEQREQFGLNQQLAGLDAMDLVKLAPGIVIGETPSNYFDRTVHSGNIGALAFDMTENFVSVNLMLPQLNSVEGNFYDGSIPAT